jgi:hypothetical protein
MNKTVSILIFSFISCFAYSAEMFEQSKIYKGYLKTPKQYRMSSLADLRKSFNAQQFIKKSKCKQGGTIESCLNKKTNIPAIDIEGWNSYPHEKMDYLIVEYSFFIGTRQTVFRWEVSGIGVVKAINGHALSITN